MQLISINDLINHKILPFDLYNENGKIIFRNGEILTPGKILQLKYIPEIYIEDSKKEDSFHEDNNDEILEILDEDEDLDEFDEEVNEEKTDYAKEAFLKESKKPVISEEIKVEISNNYKEAMDNFIEEGTNDPSLCIDIRDNIVEEILPEVHKILYRSQLKVYGDYYYAHGINVAMLSAMLAHKMHLNNQQVNDITLAAMLHDIGKIQLPDVVIKKQSPTISEIKLLQLHTRLGYNTIRKELGLAENIAQVALQHHEKSDGSGYPFGISGDFISLESHIVSICNIYDQLTSGKGEVKIKNSKEAIKYILELGTKCFKSDVLYTFVHMTNYNDFAPILTDYY